MILRCLLGHDWERMKHGGSINLSLDARRCRRCHRFEVWVFSRYYPSNAQNYPDAVPAP